MLLLLLLLLPPPGEQGVLLLATLGVGGHRHLRHEEGVRGSKYNVYATIRTDVVFYQPIPGEWIRRLKPWEGPIPTGDDWGLPFTGLEGGTNDNLFIGGHAAFRADVFQWELLRFWKTEPWLQAWVPEMLLNQSLLRSWIDIRRAPWAHCRI